MTLKTLFRYFNRGAEAKREKDRRRRSFDRSPEDSSVHDRAVDEQPQRRTYAETAKLESDRAGGVTMSGHWFASAMEAQPRSNKSRDATKINKSALAKDKRSPHQTSSQTPQVTRPKTAPETLQPPKSDWNNFSALSGNPTSPLPDSSEFPIETIIPNKDRLSWIYPGPLIPEQSHVTTVAWPLPNDPAGYPGLETVKVQVDNTAQIYPKISLIRPQAPTRLVSGQKNEQQSTRRDRAKSDPFRHVRGGKKTTSCDDHDKINDEIRELQSLVEAKRAASGSSSPQFSEHLTLKRSDSGRHVPAVAPTKKVSVGTRLLSDIGSACSTSLPSDNDSFNDPQPLELNSKDITSDSPIESRPRATSSTIESTPCIQTRPGFRRGISEPLKTLTEQTTPAESCIIGSNASTTNVSTRNETSTPQSSRSSISTFVTTPFDEYSTSKFPTAPTTPPLSSPSSPQHGDADDTPRSNIDTPQKPTRDPPSIPTSYRSRSGTQRLVFEWTLDSAQQSCRTSIIAEPLPPQRGDSQDSRPSYHIHNKKSLTSLKSAFRAPRRFVENL